MNRIKRTARLLGYKAKDNLDQIELLIEKSFLELEAISTAKTTYRILTLAANDTSLIAEYQIELVGESIKAHLEGSNRIVLMGLTLGLEIDKKIKYYQYKDLTKAFILDACASILIEELCDELEEDIRKPLKKTTSMTSRFSPGYGDLPLEFQKEISKMLKLEKTIGVMLNKNNILIPRKSVTAIIGIGVDRQISQCQYCNINCYNRGKNNDKKLT